MKETKLIAKAENFTATDFGNYTGSCDDRYCFNDDRKEKQES